MTELLLYILLTFLFLTIAFFLVRTIIITITMFSKVPYVPSNKAFKEAVRYLDIEEGDNVLDIGSGDGRVLIHASKIYPNCQFVGIEKNPILVVYSSLLKFILRRNNLHFKCIDARDFDISDFDAIYLYLLSDFVDEILLEKNIKKGCRVVSFHFPLGKKFSSINKITRYPVKYRGKEENIFKWINNEDTRR
jgi:SAM-dependent methyltransferase